MENSENQEMNVLAAFFFLFMTFLVVGSIPHVFAPWVDHKLTTYPVTDKQKIFGELKYCEYINIDIDHGNTVEHSLIVPNHMSTMQIMSQMFLLSILLITTRAWVKQ